MCHVWRKQDVCFSSLLRDFVPLTFFLLFSFYLICPPAMSLYETSVSTTCIFLSCSLSRQTSQPIIQRFTAVSITFLYDIFVLDPPPLLSSALVCPLWPVPKWHELYHHLTWHPPMLILVLRHMHTHIRIHTLVYTHFDRLNLAV